MQVARLDDRAVGLVGGADAATFLEGLVTAEVAALPVGGATHAALLTPQGKILFDFFLVRTADGFLVDAPAAPLPDLMKRLKFYRLRAKVDLAERPDLGVAVAFGDDAAADACRPAEGIAFADPRLPGLGVRVIAPADALPAPTGDAAAWHAHRIGLGVPEVGLDSAPGDAFPHDVAMDDLRGVDFGKGCYVGQEVVSRMKHRATARRRVVLVSTAAALPPSGTPVLAGGKPIGGLGSVDELSGRRRALALLRIDKAAEAMRAGTPIRAGDVDLELALPAYARFGWPEGAAAD